LSPPNAVAFGTSGANSLATIYSIRMAEASVASTSVTPYTVPAGFVAVVVSINCLFVGSGAVGSVLRSGGVANIFYHKSTAADEFAQWAGRAVLNAGESLELSTTGGTVQFFVSGYQLEGP
jgi:hypothetical protein